MDGVRNDLRFALRGVAKRPGFNLILVLILAIGIGACTMVYSLMRGALLKPFPFPDLHQLVMLWSEMPKIGSRAEAIAGPEYVELLKAEEIFSGLSAGVGYSVTLTGAGDPERLQAFLAPPQLFSMLGVEPEIGRAYRAEENRSGADLVVVISHRFWSNSFGADPAILGQQIELSNESYQVVGVMPPTFRFGRADLWLPLQTMLAKLTGNEVENMSRSSRLLWTIGRLQPGVSIDKANSWLEDFSRRTESQHVATTPEYRDWRLSVQPLRDYFLGEVKVGVWALGGTVLFVLLIICGNVANLLLVRLQLRGRELAVRRALGAGRSALLRQLFTEYALLALGGGLLGWLLAKVSLGAVVGLLPDRYLPEVPHFAIDGSVLVVMALVTVATVFLFGLVPALSLERTNLQGQLREGGQAVTANQARGRARRLLVIAEVALALVVVVGFALFAQTFVGLASRDVGFEPENVLTFHVHLPRARYVQGPQTVQFHRQLHEAIARVPGVVANGAAMMLPLEDFVLPVQRFILEGESAEEPREAVYRPVMPEYLDALQVPRVDGRLLEAGDTADATPVVVVNSAFGERFYPGGTAIGHRVKLVSQDPDEPWRTIVGIAENIAQRRLSEEILPSLYLPLAQTPAPPFWMRVAVKTSVPPKTLIPAMRAAVMAMDPGLPTFEIKTADEAIARELGGWRLCVVLLAGFATIALLVAALGLYGVVSYSVTLRSRELGLRMALGAAPPSILILILRRGLWLTGLGIIVGTAVAFALTRWLSSVSTDIQSVSPALFVGVVAFLAAVSFLASVVPALRATRIDPLHMLRHG